MTISIGGPPSGAALAAQLAGASIPGALTVAGLLTTQAGITNSGANIASSTNWVGSGLSQVQVPGGIDVNLGGSGLAVKEGANAKQGQSVLVAGTVTVANTSITANSKILLSRSVLGGTPGHLSYTTVVGTSFTITSSSATDTSTIVWEIMEPG